MLQRACPGSRTIPEGWVIRHDGFPWVRQLNALRLRASPSADRLEALAERWQAELPHRHVVVEDGDAAESLAAELEPRGWWRERVVVMTLDPAAAVARRDPRAREIDEWTLRALERAVFTEDNLGPVARSELPALLSDAQAALRRTTEARRFGAGRGTEPVAMATLYLDPDVDGARLGLVDSVGTLHRHREQGLGTAVVSAALAVAGEWGAELVAVVTDADDWPQVWYAGLGFTPVQRHVAFVRAVSSGAGE